MNNLYKLMEYDLENAENILVNSDILSKKNMRILWNNAKYN